MALSPVPHVPSSLQLLHKAAHAAWFDPAPEASEGDALGPGRGSIHRMSEQLSWAGLQGLAGKLAARMPGLVATGLEPGPDRGEDAQVGCGIKTGFAVSAGFARSCVCGGGHNAVHVWESVEYMWL